MEFSIKLVASDKATQEQIRAALVICAERIAPYTADKPALEVGQYQSLTQHDYDRDIDSELDELHVLDAQLIRNK
jgi:hypothetical protein